MNEILEKISGIGIVPVIAISDVEKAIPLAKALIAGGIPCAEITFRTVEGEESIRRIANEVPDILLGAGTVTSIEQVDRAIAAGAKFLVSPGLNPKIVSYCNEKNVPITPGCSNPSDIETAMELGLEVVKFFPAEQSGGLDYIKAISAPYACMKFMPTGGINSSNIAKYLAFDRVIACGGSWMVQKELINTANFEEITRLCKEAVHTILGLELAHIGINSATEIEAIEVAELFSLAFGLELKNGNSSVFAGTLVEVMKEPYPGKYGHIGFKVNSVARAMRFLLSKGFDFNLSTVKTDANGNPIIAYLNKEFGGFAVHLVQKR